MKLNLKYLILIFICIMLSGCESYEYRDNELINSIIIDKIGINSEYSISSIKDDVIGIVLFSEYGRPDITGDNTIIGAHSGFGSNAKFNRLIELESNDIIKLIYQNRVYTYVVDSVFEVLDTDTYILDSKDLSMLTLITCNIKDNSKRIIVSALLI